MIFFKVWFLLSFVFSKKKKKKCSDCLMSLFTNCLFLLWIHLNGVHLAIDLVTQVPFLSILLVVSFDFWIESLLDALFLQSIAVQEDDVYWLMWFIESKILLLSILIWWKPLKWSRESTMEILTLLISLALSERKKKVSKTLDPEIFIP